MRISACVGLFSLVTTSWSTQAQQHPSPHDAEKSCRTFVQEFDDWYIHVLDSGGSYDTALQYKRNAFSPELFRLMKDDSEASSRVEGEIVGIDFDPILGGQDWPKHIVAGKATLKNEASRSIWSWFPPAHLRWARLRSIARNQCTRSRFRFSTSGNTKSPRPNGAPSHHCPECSALSKPIRRGSKAMIRRSSKSPDTTQSSSVRACQRLLAGPIASGAKPSGSMCAAPGPRPPSGLAEYERRDEKKL